MKNLTEETNFLFTQDRLGLKVNAKGSVPGSTKREENLRVKRGGVCASLFAKSWGVFLQGKRHSPGNRREKKLKLIISRTKSNLWLLDSDLYSPHNDDIFTAVIGLITSHPSCGVF